MLWWTRLSVEPLPSHGTSLKDVASIVLTTTQHQIRYCNNDVSVSVHEKTKDKAVSKVKVKATTTN